MKNLVIALAALAASVPATLAFENDANHTFIGFRSSTLLFEVPGRFDRYKVDITGDPEHADGARVRIEIEAASVNTDNQRRDDHLRSADFFDVEKHPRIVFTSDRVERKSKSVIVSGTLDMRGKQAKLTIPFSEVSAINGAGFKEWVYKGTATLKRSAFAFGADSVAAKLSLSDDVQLDLLLAGFFEKPAASAK